MAMPAISPIAANPLRSSGDLGLDVFIFDYRGYGGSQGEPSEAGLYQDAAAAWRYLVETRGVSPGNIVIFGRSLGGAVAAQLASGVQPQPGGLILESTLSSARDFAKAAFPLLSRVLVVRYHFDSVARLAQVHCPVLVLHSPSDEIMPYRFGEKLYQSAHEPKRFVALRGDHNSGFMQSQPEYEQALGDFIASLGSQGIDAGSSRKMPRSYPEIARNSAEVALRFLEEVRPLG